MEIGVGQLIVIGIFATIGIGIIGLTIVGAVFLRRGLRVRDKSGDDVRIGGWDREISMGVATKILGWGIFFLAIGLGMLIAVYGVAEVSLWGIIGIALLFGGVGLIIFYLIASRRERRVSTPESGAQG